MFVAQQGQNFVYRLPKHIKLDALDVIYLFDMINMNQKQQFSLIFLVLIKKSSSYNNFTDPLRRFTNIKSMVSYLQCGDDMICRSMVTDMIQDYGCYCYPNKDQQVRASRRQPVDLIDEMCRRLHRRWNCIEMDATMNLNGISYEFYGFKITLLKYFTYNLYFLTLF